MNEWEIALKSISGTPPVEIPHHYVIQPGKRGPNIHCNLCGTRIAEEVTQFLNEIVEEAMAHELNNH